jgi:hypothetical protein
MLEEYTIRKFGGIEISYDDFLIKLKNLNDEGLNIYIGSDSQILKGKISLVTSICLYRRGIAGNQIFYIKRGLNKARYPTLRSRMLLEAYSSLEVALELDPLVGGNLTVHLDIGSDEKKNKTAKFSKELQILFKSQGFACKIKPDSWASSSVADRYTKS